MEKHAAKRTIFLMGYLLVSAPLSRDRTTIISEGIMLMVLKVEGSMPNSVMTEFATGPAKLAR